MSYRLSNEVPKTGPTRQAVEEQIRTAIQSVHRPLGYTIEAPEADESINWFKRLLVPVLLLLYAVLAVTFESLTLPLLVLLSLPLTVLGATWGFTTRSRRREAHPSRVVRRGVVSARRWARPSVGLRLS